MPPLLLGLLYAMIILSSIVVYADAKLIGVRKGLIKGLGNMDPSGWLLCCLGLWIIAFPFYLVKRGEFKRLNRKRA